MTALDDGIRAFTAQVQKGLAVIAGAAATDLEKAGIPAEALRGVEAIYRSGADEVQE